MDIIGLYSTTATYLARKEIEIGRKKNTQNKGYYAVQGHPSQIKSNQMWIYIAHCQKISNALKSLMR